MSRIRGVDSSSIGETGETDVIFHPSAMGVAPPPSGFGIEMRMRPSSSSSS